MGASPTIVWFRLDLRLDDHPALRRAAEGPVVCVFVLDDAGDGAWPMGGASRWWLHRSLAALDGSLQAVGSRLLLRRGSSAEHLAALAARVGAERVVTSARIEPAARALESAVERALAAVGASLERCPGALLHDPNLVRSGSGEPYRVFTPFWKACMGEGFDEVPLTPPTRLVDAGAGIESPPLDSLDLQPRIAWDEGLRAAWTPGEAGAKERWRSFARASIDGYAQGRDRCADDGTSRLSPHLHFGEISPRRLWHEIRKVERSRGDAAKEGLRVFRNEIGWREFAHHVLAAFPATPVEPLRPEFARFPWRRDPALLRAWQRGRTGYPLVDAGMRQLWHTGWMHNRVRMVAASFLVKHLLQPWQDGSRWFWETLVDADLANNTMGWQWSAGCGADAAPYFRIFNPVAQGERFDADGAYVRRWVPELAGVPDRWIHRPWEAPGARTAGSLPPPIVDHGEARSRALEAFAALRSER